MHRQPALGGGAQRCPKTAMVAPSFDLASFRDTSDRFVFHPCHEVIAVQAEHKPISYPEFRRVVPTSIRMQLNARYRMPIVLAMLRRPLVGWKSRAGGGIQGTLSAIDHQVAGRGCQTTAGPGQKCVCSSCRLFPSALPILRRCVGTLMNDIAGPIGHHSMLSETRYRPTTIGPCLSHIAESTVHSLHLSQACDSWLTDLYQ